MRRAWVGLLLGGIVAMGASPGPGEAPTAATSAPMPVASGPPVDLHASITVSRASFATAAAFADSLDTGIKLVRVRIVDQMDTRIELRTEDGLTLADAPVVCIHWRDAAPDDAGLESPCWGHPDPTETLLMLSDDDGPFVLGPGESIVATSTMSRGAARCDYPPGEWILRVTLVPITDGLPGEPSYVRVPFDVPYDPHEVLPAMPLDETRFCGLASEVIVQQGTPPTARP